MKSRYIVISIKSFDNHERHRKEAAMFIFLARFCSGLGVLFALVIFGVEMIKEPDWSVGICGGVAFGFMIAGLIFALFDRFRDFVLGEDFDLLWRARVGWFFLELSFCTSYGYVFWPYLSVCPRNLNQLAHIFLAVVILSVGTGLAIWDGIKIVREWRERRNHPEYKLVKG
jgi:hypothetical protein